MKRAIKIDSNISYQVNLDEEGSFVMINGVMITKKVLDELEFFQDVYQGANGSIGSSDANMNSICSGYANLFSYLIEAGDHIDRPDEHNKVLSFVQLQFASVKALSPLRYKAECIINECNGTTKRELLPSSEADAS